MTKFAIDVSGVNPISLKQFEDSPAAVLIAKATEGATWQDRSLSAHRRIAHVANAQAFGSYLFLRPDSTGSEAMNYLSYAKPAKGDLQPIIDAEVQDGESFSTVAARVDRCARALEANGYDPILYASASFWQELFAVRPDLKRLRVWEADYPSRVTKWSPKLAALRIKLQHGASVVLWQFTDSYLVDGRKFDMSVLLAPVDSLRI